MVLGVERPDQHEEAVECLLIRPGETTEDLRYTLNTVNCVGACALAPVVVVDDEYHPNMTAKKLDKQFKTLEHQADGDSEDIGHV